MRHLVAAIPPADIPIRAQSRGSATAAYAADGLERAFEFPMLMPTSQLTAVTLSVATKQLGFPNRQNGRAMSLGRYGKPWMVNCMKPQG